jgi:uncharacterized SAM-binding protein YcdF (DUF218 family)
MHTIRALSWERLSSIGWDGFATLLCSMAMITVSGGMALLVCWIIVVRFSRIHSARAQDTDVVLILGSRLNKGRITPDFEARLAAAERLAGHRPVIVLGGMARKGSRSEAAAGRSWLVERAFDRDRIIVEEVSRNTLENLFHARRLIREHGFRRPLLITSRYHLARASILARGLGIAHEMTATDYPTMWHPAALARSFCESLFLNWYYVGRAVARLIRNQSMLARIS